jgi:hypothetical protein
MSHPVTPSGCTVIDADKGVANINAANTFYFTSKLKYHNLMSQLRIISRCHTILTYAYATSQDKGARSAIMASSLFKFCPYSETSFKFAVHCIFLASNSLSFDTEPCAFHVIILFYHSWLGWQEKIFGTTISDILNTSAIPVLHLQSCREVYRST